MTHNQLYLRQCPVSDPYPITILLYILKSARYAHTLDTQRLTLNVEEMVHAFEAETQRPRFMAALWSLLDLTVVLPSVDAAHYVFNALNFYRLDDSYEEEEFVSEVMLELEIAQPQHDYLTQTLYPHLLALDFNTLKRLSFRALVCYEYLMAHTKTQKQVELTLEHSRQLLHAKGAGYDRFNNYHSKVIEPTLHELNVMTPTTWELTFKKQNRAITHLTLTKQRQRRPRLSTTPQKTPTSFQGSVPF